MELSYYGFAFFIFVLLCSFALLCRVIFLRGKAERQNFDEKEKKLLALYSTMEEMMDEFNQTALSATEEMTRRVTEMRSARVNMGQPPPPRQTLPPLPPPINTPMPSMVAEDMRSSSPVSSTPENFISLAPREKNASTERLPDRHTRILALHDAGLDRLNIAEQLSVTLGEVDLVLGLAALGPRR